jgi:SET domain-containing protein
MHLPFAVGVSSTLHIRGLLATEDIKKGQIIERCPLILIPYSQEEVIDKTILKKYYFEWTREYIAIALGYGSLINHSYTPNVKYFHDYKNTLLTFRAIKAITAGEELFINYNWDPSDTETVSEELIDFNKEIVT